MNISDLKSLRPILPGEDISRLTLARAMDRFRALGGTEATEEMQRQVINAEMLFTGAAVQQGEGGNDAGSLDGAELNGSGSGEPIGLMGGVSTGSSKGAEGRGSQGEAESEATGNDGQGEGPQQGASEREQGDTGAKPGAQGKRQDKGEAMTSGNEVTPAEERAQKALKESLDMINEANKRGAEHKRIMDRMRQQIENSKQNQLMQQQGQMPKLPMSQRDAQKLMQKLSEMQKQHFLEKQQQQNKLEQERMGGQGQQQEQQQEQEPPPPPFDRGEVVFLDDNIEWPYLVITAADVIRLADFIHSRTSEDLAHVTFSVRLGVEDPGGLTWAPTKRLKKSGE